MSKQDSNINCISIGESTFVDNTFDETTNNHIFSSNSTTQNIDNSLDKSKYLQNLTSTSIDKTDDSLVDSNNDLLVIDDTVTTTVNNNNNNTLTDTSCSQGNESKNDITIGSPHNTSSIVISPEKQKYETNQVKISLVDEKLWEKFHAYVNEMIVTKDGRRMFPVLKIKIEGLDPSSMYTVNMDFSISDNHRWKFMNGRWIRGNKEDNIKNSSNYMHCDSPNFGTFWLNNLISFSKLKISNKVSKDPSKIQIHSLFRYIPRIHIYSIDNTTRGLTHVITKHFDCTEFVAVTAYQNDAITRLKVSYNPFAKAFLDVKRSGNESPPTIINNISQNRDIYKPYESTSMKTFQNNNNNTCNNMSNSKDLKHSSYHIDSKHLPTMNNDNYHHHHQVANNSTSTFFYSPNISSDINTNYRQIRPISTNILPPHYCDYFHTTAEQIRNNIEPRTSNTATTTTCPTNATFYNTTNYKSHNFPYMYQYNCPTGYYYDKQQQYVSSDGSYLYSNKNENIPSNNNTTNNHHHSSTTSSTTNTNLSQYYNATRNLNSQPVHQYSTQFNNYQSVPLYKEVKDIKMNDKNTLKSGQTPPNIRDEKFINNDK